MVIRRVTILRTAGALIFALLVVAVAYLVYTSAVDPGENYFVLVNASPSEVEVCDVIVEVGHGYHAVSEWIRPGSVQVIPLPTPFPSSEIVVLSDCAQFEKLTFKVSEGRAGHVVVFYYPGSGEPEMWMDRMPPGMDAKLRGLDPAD